MATNPDATEGIDSQPTNSSDTGPKPKRAKAQATPLRTLPDRARALNPGKPDVRRAKRTPAEVKADKKRKEKLAQQLRKTEERRVQLLAQMELDEESADMEEDENVVRTLGQVSEEEREGFSFTEVDAEDSEQSSDGGSCEKVNARTQSKKGVCERSADTAMETD
jgi:hypothetical protein